MDKFIYTSEIDAEDSISTITSSDIVLLNNKNIVLSIDQEYNGVNPIPAFTIVKDMSSMLSAKIADIDDELSAHDAELSNHMQYYGSLAGNYEQHSLHDFLKLALDLQEANVIDKGLMLRFISSATLVDSSDNTINLLSNDYIIFNKDVTLANVQISDFDIIRDAQVETEYLSNALCLAISSASQNLYEIISATSSDLCIGLSNVIDTKQDNLSEEQISAIDSVVDERTTIMKFADGTISSFNFIGSLTYQILSNAIADDDKLTTIVDAKIGTSVIQIGKSLFWGCSQLSNVYLPNSIKHIGKEAFYLCENLSNITIPSNVTQIENQTFRSCINLTGITIPNSITSIGLEAFCYCINLSCIDIPDSVTYIDENAFSSCEKLQSIVVGNNVSYIGDQAFQIGSQSPLTSVIFKGKSLSEVQSMENYPWALYNEKIITTKVVDGYDVEMKGGDLYVLSGNYIQTSTPDKVNVYSSKNSFLQAEYVKFGYGNPSIGSKGFVVLSVIAPNKLMLSGQIDNPQQLQSLTSNWSVILSTNIIDSQFGKITAYEIVDGNVIVTFDKNYNEDICMLSALNSDDLTSMIQESARQNALYYPLCADVGNYIIENFNSNHAEGGSVHAIGRYSHAEGFGSIAEGQASHAEGGSDNLKGGNAIGIGSHAEGFATKAIGNASHAEGQQTSAAGLRSHAEGTQTSAFGENSHAEGDRSKAIGNASHAEGVNVSTFGDYSHAEGYLTRASGNYSHAEGSQTSAIALGSHAAGIKAQAGNQRSWIWNGVDSTIYKTSSDSDFYINPKNGLNGFYIGNRSLCAYLSGEIDTNVTVFKNQMKGKLSVVASDPILNSLSDGSEFEDIISGVVKMRDILSSLYSIL